MESLYLGMPEVIKAVARHRCARDGFDPDTLVHYELGPSGPLRRDPIKEDWVGTIRFDGSRVEQWPTMPYWRWKYEAGAKADMEVAAAMLQQS